MPILQYETRVSPEGFVTLPAEFHDRKVVVRIEDGDDWPTPTEEQRKAAGRKFFETWDGLLEGMPDMTAKEIRAERLERKYGQ